MTRFSDIYHHVSTAKCTEDVLLEIKSKYAAKVASNRQLAHCKTVGDVVYILEKRDEINSENYNILEELYVLLRDQNESHPLTPPPVEKNGTPEVRVLPTVPNDLYARLHQVISMQIGYKWKDFARSLGIPEGQIDELEDRHRNISDRIRDILVYHQHACPSQFQNSTIFNALCRARRKDLALRVQYIIDTT